MTMMTASVSAFDDVAAIAAILGALSLSLCSCSLLSLSLPLSLLLYAPLASSICLGPTFLLLCANYAKFLCLLLQQLQQQQHLQQCLSETNVANIVVGVAVDVGAHVVQTFPLHCMIAILRKTILFVLFRFVLCCSQGDVSLQRREELIVAKVAQSGVFNYPIERETGREREQVKE